MTDLINNERSGQPLNERSTAELVKLASEQISQLVRDELKLAQVELARKGKHAGIGIGLFGGAGVTALYGVAALLTTVVLLLALVMPAWLACLIVTVVLLVVAGVLALIGRSQVKKATPPMPEQAVGSVKADIDAVTGAVKERGHR
jgi:Flp pilus assembly protein TadB